MRQSAVLPGDWPSLLQFYDAQWASLSAADKAESKAYLAKRILESPPQLTDEGELVDAYSPQFKGSRRQPRAAATTRDQLHMYLHPQPPAPATFAQAAATPVSYYGPTPPRPPPPFTPSVMAAPAQFGSHAQHLRQPSQRPPPQYVMQSPPRLPPPAQFAAPAHGMLSSGQRPPQTFAPRPRQKKGQKPPHADDIGTWPCFGCGWKFRDERTGLQHKETCSHVKRKRDGGDDTPFAVSDASSAQRACDGNMWAALLSDWSDEPCQDDNQISYADTQPRLFDAVVCSRPQAFENAAVQVGPHARSKGDSASSDRGASPSASLSSAPEQAGATKLRVVELFAGIGGVASGLHAFAQQCNVSVEVVLAVDNDPATAQAYQQLYAGTPFMCASVGSAAVRDRVVTLAPDVITICADCCDFSPAGLRVEGEAAQGTVRAAELIRDASPRLGFIENVPAMLTSDAWARAESTLHGAGYSLVVAKCRGTDANGSSSRQRVYIVCTATGPETQGKSERLMAALNEEFRASIPRSIAEALPTSSQTFYWDPRNDKAPGVLSTDVPMPSPVTRHASGRRPPPHYVSRNGDAGDAHQALVLSAQDVAKLLGFEHQLPPAPKAKQAGWAAKLIQPNVVSLFFKCIHAVSPLPTGWKRPDGSQWGKTLVHDRTAPPPEWVVESEQGSALLLSTTVLAAKAALKSACGAMKSAWQSVRAALCRFGQSATVTESKTLDALDWAFGEDEEWLGRERFLRVFAMPRRAASKSAAPRLLSVQSQRDPVRLMKPNAKARRNGFIQVWFTVCGDVGPRRVKLRALIDSGAEYDLLSPKAVRSLGGTLESTQSGDFTAIGTVDSDNEVPVLGAVTVQLQLGDATVRRRFLVASIPYDLILGSAFFGEYKSVISYEDGFSFLPFGAKGPTLQMHEIRGGPHSSVVKKGGDNATTGACNLPMRHQTRGERQRYLVRAAEDVMLLPGTESHVDVYPHPAYTGGHADVLLTADAPESTLSARRLARQDARMVDSADVAQKGCVLHMAAQNNSPLPVRIRKGTILGVMERTVDVLSTEQMTAAKLASHLYAGVVKSMSLRKESASEFSPSARVCATEEERRVHRQKVADEHNAPLEHCSDEDLRGMLLTDGQLREVFRGRDEGGITWAERVMEVLRKRRGVFTKDPKNPHVTPFFDVEIDTGEAEPIADKARRWSEREASFIMEHIDQMQKRGQIRPSYGPWACNPVLVVQHDKIRCCIDYRKLNKITRRDEHGLGNMEDLMTKVASSKIFSALDLAAGYHQIPMAEDSACKTAFRAPDGSLWEYIVATFGLVCLPSIFTRSMHTVLGDAMRTHACVYVDDVLVHSKSIEEHIQHLDDTLGRIERYGMSVARHKCQLFEFEVTYLGHRLGWHGTRPCEDKVKAMLDMAPPLNKEGKVDKRLVQVALGCFNYYRRYIHRFAHISAPLVECTKEGASMDWTVERQQAFNALKKAMASAPVVGHPDWSKPFALHTDASKVAVAAVLTQYQDLAELRERSPQFKWARTSRLQTVDGKPAVEIVIGFFSKINSVSDAKLGATALECLAVVPSLNYFRAYVWGRPVTVVTDASALRWLLTLNDANGKLLRWAMRLQEYDLLVVHRAGKQNANADGPSRLPQMVDILLPQPVEHADEQWPDCVDAGKAPPSGVRFQSTANVELHRVHENAKPMRVKTMALWSPLCTRVAAALSRAQAQSLLDDEEDNPTSDITVFLKRGGMSPALCVFGLTSQHRLLSPCQGERRQQRRRRSRDQKNKLSPRV